MNSDLNPIFVHASPRSGSTYLFNVLRRDTSLMCFNEAIIDIFSAYGGDVAGFRAAQKWNVNHHFLDRDDFDEFVQAWDAAMHLYPPYPSFQDYLPANGAVGPALRAYLGALMSYARSQNRRPALCEIHSRGRAGALRDAFGGFHIAQYRNPLSQFGSFLRPLLEAGEWGFLTFPLMELGISGAHPLYRLVPEAWRVPVLPWPAGDRARRWASAVQYMSMVAAPGAASIERLLRWHLFSWMLSNLAAISYSDFILDIDKTYEDADYRQSVIDSLESKCDVRVNFGDLSNFPRYYEFESLDVAAVCDEVASTMRDALRDDRIDAAVRALATQAPTVPPAAAVELLLVKLRESLTAMSAASDRSNVSLKDWEALTRKHRKIWFNPRLRAVGQRAHPIAAPIVRAAQRIGIWH